MPDMTRKFKIELTKRERRELEALVRKQSIGAAFSATGSYLVAGRCQASRWSPD